MNKPLFAPLDEEAMDVAVEPAHPQVFVRAFTVPAALPWEQTRAAQLEARHGAPLPISEVMFRLRRLGTWGLGRAGRFAVFYIRSREFKAPFETVVDVDGEALKVAFGGGAEQLRRAGSGAAWILLAGLVAGLLVLGPFLALNARREVEARVATLETALTAKAALGAEAQRKRENARALRLAVGKTAPVGEVLADIAWATSVKADDARIVAIHWDHGFLAAEARSKTPPFRLEGDELERSDGPVRPGVWLWGLRPHGQADGSLP